MHSIGLPDQAVRYYKAAQGLLVPGSEMRLIVDINLMAAEGGFSNLHTNLDRAAQVNVMADQCRAGTNGALNAVGFFLLSLTDHERVSSKYVGAQTPLTPGASSPLLTRSAGGAS
jgi:hypothetical protein